MRAVLPRPPSSSTIARRTLDRSGARHCSGVWGGDRARSEVVRIAETRSKQTADTNVSQCSRSIAGAHRCGAVCWCTRLCMAAGSSADARASREALAAVLTASPALLRGSASFLAPGRPRQCPRFCWLVCYMPLAPLDRWRELRALLRAVAFVFTEQLSTIRERRTIFFQSVRRPAAGFRVSALCFQRCSGKKR